MSLSVLSLFRCAVFSTVVLLHSVSAFLSSTAVTSKSKHFLKYQLFSTSAMEPTFEERTKKLDFDISSFYDYDGARKDDSTKEFVMQQTMIRVKDPKKSLEFYVDVLGFSLIMHRDFPQWGFSVYFVAQIDDPSKIPKDPDEQWTFCMNTPGCIEVTWNHGSEEESVERVYNTGNADSTGTKDGENVKGGFGHLGVTVPDVYKACERFKELGCEFHKSPNSGGMKGLAFVKDPDGYLVEILPQGPFAPQKIDCCGVTLEGGPGYKDNSK